MYCKNCGKKLEDGKEVCLSCQANENSKTEVNEGPVNVVKEVNNNSNNAQNSFGKSRIAAGLFGIFLGFFGVHNFYLGYTGKAVAQLVMSLGTCGILLPISALWGLIEGIFILSGDINKDAEGNPLRNY